MVEDSSKQRVYFAASGREVKIGLARAHGCLEKLLPDSRARPSLRWFEGLQAAGKIPFRKIGRKVWFDPEEVRRALDKQFCV